MSVFTFTVEHNRLIDGPFPKQEMLESLGEGSTIEIVEFKPFREKVTFTIDNKMNENEMELVYNLGMAVQSVIFVNKLT